MKKPLLHLAAIALLSLAVASCKKDSSSTTKSSSASIDFAVTGDTPTAVVSSVGGPQVQSTGTNATSANITWTSGIINIAHFKLETKRNGTEVEISTNQLKNIDLFSINPSTITAKIDTGTYKEIELRILLEKSTGTDIPLSLKGTFTTAGGAVVPIQFDFNETALIKLEAENITVDGTQNLLEGVSFHLNKLLSGIHPAALDAATRTSGTILINESTNTAIYNQVKVNIFLALAAKHIEMHHK